MNEEKLPDLGLEVGDKVEWDSMIGVVTFIDRSSKHPIFVKFPDPDYLVALSFMANGKFHKKSEYPLLKVLKVGVETNEKIKVTLYRYTYEQGTYVYQTIWDNEDYLDPSMTIIKTETKEIEID